MKGVYGISRKYGSRTFELLFDKNDMIIEKELDMGSKSIRCAHFKFDYDQLNNFYRQIGDALKEKRLEDRDGVPE